jgi:hypothetical protein
MKNLLSMDVLRSIFCLPLPVMEMDDSLTYAGVARELIARRVQAKTESILRALRQYILADKKLLEMPTEYVLPCPCVILEDEMPLLLVSFQKYGWYCHFCNPSTLVFAKNDDHPHTD